MPMPTIRIDDEVYNWLKGQAEPFADSPNSVLRRHAGLDHQPAEAAPLQRARIEKSRRARPGELLDRREYDLPILRVLDGMGGAGHASDVVDQVGNLLVSELTEMDMTENDSGVVRWRNRIMWRRHTLVRLGLLKDDSPHGVWEISEDGRQALWRAEKIDYGA